MSTGAQTMYPSEKNQFDFFKNSLVVDHNSQDPEKSAREESLIALAYDWASNSPVNGIPNVVRSQNLIKRFFWLVALLGCFGVMGYQTWELVAKFYRFPVDTTLTYTHSKEVYFPAVTVCNVNPLRRSMLSSAGDDVYALLGPPKSQMGSSPGGAQAPAGPAGSFASQSQTTQAAAGPPGPASSSITTQAPAAPGPKGSGSGGTTQAPSASQTTVGAPAGGGGGTTKGSASSQTTAGAPAGGGGGTTKGQASSQTTAGAPAGGGGGTTQAPAGPPAPPSGRKRRSTGTNSTSTSRRKPGQMNERFEMRKRFGNIWAKLNYTTRETVGHELDTMIISCTFNGVTCSSANFTRFNNHQFGNCYTFNSGWDSSIPVETSSNAGPLYGLSLEMYIEQSEYIGDLSESAGVRVQIHSQRSMAFPEDEGFNIAPGYLTSMAMTRVEITRRPHPYPSKCRNFTTEESKQKSVFTSVHNVDYSVSGCMKTCYQRYVISECACGDPAYPFSLDLEAFSDLKNNINGTTAESVDPCVSDADDECVAGIKRRFADDDLSCDCPLTCVDVEYSGVPSLAKWPSKQYMSTLHATLASAGAHLDNIINGKNGMAAEPGDNLLKLEVYFQELNFQKISENVAYDVFALLADIGGQIGFWVGLSIMALFEVVELILDVFRLLLFRVGSFCFKKQQKRPPSRQVKVQPASEENVLTPRLEKVRFT
ncbi:amiloride-sensitive sodium channel subunit alpha isoform X2 [Lingula anatina]|uniref:Amiloride-sensitive sodium channel subunit alpha isoform X1 n=1 Tax=Lingula anatina TaxID=7574 RepID=A0A1S3H4D2_LINAN|nr:amiloride-sensitive sodium channel subunit alpha isoform X1 [Lingula anatina]XP_013380996.1 amiloride-sensitive sodium channel subunit alpha isoform X2 [Lingula anatina]|eukprot:XP_013380995.1 amiloride-sensitive sodium channel subunit alpha isoform X1 [Lingula anatina]